MAMSKRHAVAILSCAAALTFATVLCGCDRHVDAGGCDPHTNIKGAKVWLPGESGFDEKRLAQYAGLMGPIADVDANLNPRLLVSCGDEEQVQSALSFARTCGHSVVIRGGGHSYTGLSSCRDRSCMQLDVSEINHLSVDDDLLTVGPGARLLGFNLFMRNHSLSLPHGVCTGVGIGGHLQSSAYGPLSHAYGSGLDHVESFRMVLANGVLINVSRHDANTTLYKSILGSAPGSWGVITEYTVRGIRDTDTPPTLMIRAQYDWSKANFTAVLRHLQFIAKDQEDRNLRDMRVIMFAAPPSEGDDLNMYIRVHMLWTGVDSGDMTQEWQERYVGPLLNLMPDQYHDVPSVLSNSTLLTAWTNHGDRYAMQDLISDRWWSDEFIDKIADEMDERVKMMPDMYPSFQFNPLGTNSQWTRNAGMNSLTWRVFRAYADDWMFVKNESLYQEAVNRLHDFRERTRSFWQFSDGSERSTWMSPRPNASNLRDAANARQFFPNSTQFQQLRSLKAELDPTGLFHNPNTIPLPTSADSSDPMYIF